MHLQFCKYGYEIKLISLFIHSTKRDRFIVGLLAGQTRVFDNTKIGFDKQSQYSIGEPRRLS
jgi:hypothetical protein